MPSASACSAELWRLHDAAPAGAGFDKIAMGVSVAPVTDWALYDTHYTEQFMGTPKEKSRRLCHGRRTPN
jgi:hypothetical protein